jgi:hypothetical protein
MILQTCGNKPGKGEAILRLVLFANVFIQKVRRQKKTGYWGMIMLACKDIAAS